MAECFVPISIRPIFIFLVAVVMSNYLTTDGLKTISLLPEAPLRPVAFATSATWLIRHWLYPSVAQVFICSTQHNDTHECAINWSLWDLDKNELFWCVVTDTSTISITRPCRQSSHSEDINSISDVNCQPQQYSQYNELYASELLLKTCDNPFSQFHFWYHPYTNAIKLLVSSSVIICQCADF